MTEILDAGQIITRRKSGATLKEIEDLIDGVSNKSIGDIVIVGGTRETVDHVPTTQLKEGAEKLLRKAKSVAPSVTFSSVLPYLKKADPGHLAEVNNILRSVCDELDVKFVDQNANFTFRNGDADAAAFHEDGIHLSDSGVDRLLTNLALPGQSNKQQREQRQARAQRPAARESGRNVDNGWRVVSRRGSNQESRTPGQCAVWRNQPRHAQVPPQCSSTVSAMQRMGTQREAPNVGLGWGPM